MKLNRAFSPSRLKSEQKRGSLALLFLAGVILLYSSCIAASTAWQRARVHIDQEIRASSNVETSHFFETCNARIIDYIQSDFNDPSKEERAEFFQLIAKKGFEIRSDLDAKNRPLFVSTQGDIEKALGSLLREKEIVHLIGMVHTPTPATPLCTEGDLSTDLVDPSLLQDPKRLYTVLKRPQIIRDYLRQGGVLFTLFPEGGRDKRTSEQLAIYDAELAKYPYQLIEHVLGTAKLENNMVGATYLFKLKSGGWGAFAIQASQANAPNDEQKWGMWFGPLNHPEVSRRVESVMQYIYDIGGPDFSKYLFQKTF